MNRRVSVWKYVKIGDRWRYCIVCEGDISTSMKQLEDYRKAERAIRAKERNGHTLGTLKPTKQRPILAEKSN